MTKLIYLISTILALLIFSYPKNSNRGYVINREASFPSSFKFLDLKLKVITSVINIKQSTTSLLYGNDLAYKKSTLQNHKPGPGELYVYVTWSQQPNPDWFGSKIPYKLLLLEVIKISTTNKAKAKIDYKRYIGGKLIPSEDTVEQNYRINYILEQKQAILP